MATASYPTPHEDSLSKHLQCSLCLQDYHDARILPCFHTFCARCLETSCLQQTDAGKPSLYCPVCMDESDLPQKGVQGLPKNMYVQNLQDLQSIPAAPQNAIFARITNLPSVAARCAAAISANSATKPTSVREKQPITR